MLERTLKSVARFSFSFYFGKLVIDFELEHLFTFRTSE